MQGCTYKKYYLKINFFIFKNKFHPYKRLKKNLDKSKKLFKYKYITNKIIVI
jgi:hypothetical protein